MQKDHFHFCIKITNRALYRGFIRALAGVISQKLGKGIWALMPKRDVAKSFITYRWQSLRDQSWRRQKEEGN